MKKLFFIAAAAFALLAASCDSTTTESGTLTDEQQLVLDSYADDIIIATYSDLATSAKGLLEAVQAIQSSTADDKTSLIATATESWLEARTYWERSEAYLFGPVDQAGIDPGIDSWPLGLTTLKTSIQNWDAENDNYLTLKPDGGDLKGFHAIEYMIFADGAAKTTTIATFTEGYGLDQGDMTDDEFEAKLESYLVAVTEELYRCVLQLEAEWDLAGLSSTKLADFNTFGDNITLSTTAGNYGELFKNPDLDNSIYSSFTSSLEEAFVGAIGIAEEVADVKISDPINSDNGLLEVESWFSWNSIADFTNNVRGIKEAYFGKRYVDYPSTFDTDTEVNVGSVGAYVAGIDNDANDVVVAALNAAIAAVNSMIYPFRDNLTWDDNNTAAKEAVSAVQEALEAAQSIVM
ncbi:MAG: imelysin family protein [bacterium]